MKRNEFLFKLPLSVFGILSLQLINSCGQREKKNSSESTFSDSIDSQTREKLWLLYNSILVNWKLKGFSNIVKADFDTFLDNRIDFHKKYGHVYNLMAANIQESTVENFKSTLEQLADLDDGDTIKIIIKEFQTHAVVNGGFRKFHLKNYYGFIGGSYTDPKSLPYRT